MNKADFRAAFVLLLTTILFSNCTKIDTTTVGAGLIPGIDNIYTFDTTFNVVANNFDGISECDSIGHNDLLASGIISNDPLFGKARAEMYFEFKPGVFPAGLPQHDTLTMTVDSVVLVLKYNHSYGDTDIAQKLSVHELSENLSSDSIYKTCSPLSYSPGAIADITFTPASLKDSIHAFQEDDANQLRIRMPDSFGEDYIKNVSKFISDSAFKEYFKGFAIVPDDASGGNAINYFDLNSASSRLSIYVKSKRDTITDTSSINLTFTAASAQANYLAKERGSSEMTHYVNNAPDGDSLLFIQAYPAGSYAELKIPGLSGLPNVVINRAELVIQQVYDASAGKFNAPRLLYLDLPDGSGNYIPIPCDFSLSELQSGLLSLGGRPLGITDADGKAVVRYTFNIPRYIQSIVTKKEENSVLRLRAPFYIENRVAYLDRCGQAIDLFSYPANSLSDGGVKLDGSNQNDTHIRLRIIYSKL